MSSTVFKREIKMTFDSGSIEKALQEIEQFEKDLHEAVSLLCEELLEDGVTHAKAEVALLSAVDSGFLMESIGHGVFDRQTGKGIVYAGSYHAVFVEFGTGIVGEENQHPGIASGEIGSFAVQGPNGHLYTKYDTYHHEYDGWWYLKGENGQYRWTKGMPARPFMYNTLNTLVAEVEKHGGERLATFIW